MSARAPRPDDPARLRRFKAEFFKALAHPVRIAILEVLRAGPRSVGEIQALTGVPGSSISQQLAVLRGRGIVVPERAGTTIHYHTADPEIYALLDAAREIFYGHLSDSADLLRLVEAEQAEHLSVAAGP
jgi:ArsR family transcriptional regulator